MKKQTTSRWISVFLCTDFNCIHGANLFSDDIKINLISCQGCKNAVEAKLAEWRVSS